MPLRAVYIGLWSLRQTIDAPPRMGKVSANLIAELKRQKYLRLQLLAVEKPTWYLHRKMVRKIKCFIIARQAQAYNDGCSC